MWGIKLFVEKVLSDWLMVKFLLLFIIKLVCIGFVW